MAKIKFHINKDRISFSKGGGELTEPFNTVCEICNDDGICLNNINHPNYHPDNDVYDCADYLNVKEGKPKRHWMMEWANRLKESETKNQSKGGFKEWAKKHY